MFVVISGEKILNFYWCSPPPPTGGFPWGAWLLFNTFPLLKSTLQSQLTFPFLTFRKWIDNSGLMKSVSSHPPFGILNFIPSICNIDVQYNGWSFCQLLIANSRSWGRNGLSKKNWVMQYSNPSRFYETSLCGSRMSPPIWVISISRSLWPWPSSWFHSCMGGSPSNTGQIQDWEYHDVPFQHFREHRHHDINIHLVMASHWSSDRIFHISRTWWSYLDPLVMVMISWWLVGWDLQLEVATGKAFLLPSSSVRENGLFLSLWYLPFDQ